MDTVSLTEHERRILSVLKFLLKLIAVTIASYYTFKFFNS